MDMKSKIQEAKLATSLGWIDEKDWKTPKILFNAYRNTVQQKAVKNAAKAGCIYTRDTEYKTYLR